MRVLLTGAQDVQSITVARALKREGCVVYGFMTSRISYGYFSHAFWKCIICPDVKTDSEGFQLELMSFLATHQIDVIIPLSDGSAAFVSKNKTELEKQFGVKCAVPDYEIFCTAHNKGRLMDICRQYDIPHPRTFTISADMFEEAVAYVGFPALIKPDISEGARGIVYVESAEQVRAKVGAVIKEFGSCTLQQYIRHTGVYYNVMLYRGAAGECLGQTVIRILRYFPLKGGTSCYCESVEEPELVAMCFSLLDRIGWVGFADFDIMQEADTGAYKIIEINPRTPASIKAAYVSGVDFPSVILRDTLGLPVPEYRYESGKILRYMGLDVMWFLFSPERFRFRPSWFRFFGKNIFYEDGYWNDPLPMLAGCVAGVIKYLNPRFRRSKLC